MKPNTACDGPGKPHSIMETFAVGHGADEVRVCPYCRSIIYGTWRWTPEKLDACIDKVLKQRAAT